MDRIAVGRIVHYVFTNKHGELVHRPAIVVNDWSATHPNQMVNLQVLVDGTNDVDDYKGSIWATSVPHSESPVENTWHWPMH